MQFIFCATASFLFKISTELVVQTPHNLQTGKSWDSGDESANN